MAFDKVDLQPKKLMQSNDEHRVCVHGHEGHPFDFDAPRVSLSRLKKHHNSAHIKILIEISKSVPRKMVAATWSEKYGFTIKASCIVSAAPANEDKIKTPEIRKWYLYE